ncbi:hypothetical protein [Neobacillus sp. 19]|uniref:hypothetical protein n=1 Tax=Neobacillus sp. 19 TaxID=3394458 RepID=UPI003BF695BF
MKVQTVGSISEFLSDGRVHREPESFSSKVERHFKKYGMIYKVAGITFIILASGIGSHTFAAGFIDVEATKLYRELVGIGKWFIAFKGGVEVIKSVGSGDFDSAKKSFFSYLLTYLFLLALPYGLDKVDSIFNNATPSTSTRGW